MTTQTTTQPAQQNGNGNRQQGRGAVTVFKPPRLPYDPIIEERFGIDKAGWKALTESIFPAAQTADSVVLALSYCKARKLDPFKRVVHIVPVWDGQQRRMVETVWPGIAELRTTAFRTGDFAGRDHPEFGPDVTMEVGGATMTFPEWCRVTVYRIVKGERREFPGPRVYWLETYAQVKRDDPTPNSMWKKRPRGQLEKCAEAAALRAAFPEEIGGDYAAEEMEGQTFVGAENAKDVTPKRAANAAEQLDQFTNGSGEQHDEPADEAIGHDPETGEVHEDASQDAGADPADESQDAPQGEAEAAQTADEEEPATEQQAEPEQTAEATAEPVTYPYRHSSGQLIVDCQTARQFVDSLEGGMVAGETDKNAALWKANRPTVMQIVEQDSELAERLMDIQGRFVIVKPTAKKGK